MNSALPFAAGALQARGRDSTGGAGRGLLGQSWVQLAQPIHQSWSHHPCRAAQHLQRSSHGSDGVRAIPETWAKYGSARGDPAWGMHCLVACLVRGGKVLTPGFSTCSNGSPRLRPHLSRLTGGWQPQSVSCHAEIAAMNRMPMSTTARVLRQCILVVVRPSYDSGTHQTRLLRARPCKECAAAICRLGIKAVIYSDGDMLLRRTPIELMAEASASWGTRQLRCCKEEAIRAP
mmetsp:Transcript_125534/g.313648  ORF Transcript_125534/g.313648 Transcript_125534/m.313648 type:complete len:233 (+) Transcript_125534:90-788(+)